MASTVASSAALAAGAPATAAAATSSASRSSFLPGAAGLGPKARRGAVPPARKGGRQPRVVITRAAAAPTTNGDKPFAAWDLPPTIPFREDIKTIMVIGAGPIIIGQVRSAPVAPLPFNLAAAPTGFQLT